MFKNIDLQEMLDMLEKAKDELDTKGEDEIQNLLEKVCNQYKSFEPCFC